MVLGAVISKRGKVEVGPEVGSLTPQPQGSHEVEEQGRPLKKARGEQEAFPEGSLRRGKRGRGVDKEGQVEAGNEPVVARVFEQVEQRHGGGRKLVDVNRLNLPLEEMQHAQREDELLSKRVLKRLTVKELLAKEDDGVSQQRAQVLQNKHRSPGDLRTQVLDKHNGRIREQIVAHGVLGLEHNVLFLGSGSPSGLTFVSDRQSNSRFGQFGSSAQFGHHRGHRVLRRHLEVGRETLELGLGGSRTQRKIDHGVL